MLVEHAFICCIMKLDGRVVAVKGDVTGGPTLGIDPEMLRVIRDETDVVINLCADINLTKTAAELAVTNILGALAVAELAKTFPKLERFVGVDIIAFASTFTDYHPDLRLDPVFSDPSSGL